MMCSRKIAVVLCLALFIGARPARADEAADKRTAAEFSLWLHHRAEQFNIPYTVVNTVVIAESKAWIGRTYWYGILSQYIAGDDQSLMKYLDQIEDNQKQYGRISRYDRELLADMGEAAISVKRGEIARFERVARDLKIEIKTPDAVDGKPSAPASGPPRRYNPDSGLWERFDEAQKKWSADGTSNP